MRKNSETITGQSVSPSAEPGRELELTREKVEALLEKATPGPWQQAWDKTITDEHGNFNICTLGQTFSHGGPDREWEDFTDAEANAPLIAAAPDLARAYLEQSAARLAAEAHARALEEAMSELVKETFRYALQAAGLDAALAADPVVYADIQRYGIAGVVTWLKDNGETPTQYWNRREEKRAALASGPDAGAGAK